MTQEEANAIAEMEYPYDDNMFDRDIKRYRIAYVKCLMDLNPLIEAGEAMRDYMAMHTKAGLQTMTITQEWDTALSNLTKSIEP